MKAVVYDQYGSPDDLHLQEVEMPAPKEHQVRIRVHACSVNGSDWEGLTGKPLYARIGGPRKILGADIAGRVESVGSAARQFQPGDEVFGETLRYAGGFAEYVCVSEKALARKPAWMTFEQAAAIPQSAVIALQGMRAGQVQPGQHVLINGAGGGAGSFAVQLAKHAGAEVTGVDHGGKLDFLRSLGADHVIDYTRQDFTRSGQAYDLILDIVAHHASFALLRALRPQGQYLLAGGSVATLIQLLILGPILHRTTGKRLRLLSVHPNRADLEIITELVAAGKIVPMIDRIYPLDAVPEALRYVGEKRARGKVVIRIDPAGP